MLRDPTCDETDVSYDMTPCVGESAYRCAGLKGKKLKKCHKKQCEIEGDSCDGLKGKELKKCKQLEKCIRKRTDDSCDGLEGKKLKKCEKKQKQICKRKQKNKDKKGGTEEAEGWYERA